MPTSLRLGALLFASVSADQISLMQDVKKSSKRDGKHMSALMESAKGMLKNGATPDVVSFAEETLADIAGVVIPAIEHESQTQQAQVLDKFRKIRHLIHEEHGDLFSGETLPEWKRNILQWSNEVIAASTDHKECRDVEVCLCYGDGDVPAGVDVHTPAEMCTPHCPEDKDCKRPCEIELYRLWTIWVGEETDLREFHTNIHGHFCPEGANGTTHAFRQASVPWMDSYMSQKVIVDAAEAAYDNFRPQCIGDHNNLDARSTQCNQLQFNLESKACSEARAVQQTLVDFEARYSSLVLEANSAVQNARTDEVMRHREYRQIRIVECLLNRIHELNGQPCDGASGEIDAEMSHCHAEGEGIEICAHTPLLVSRLFIDPQLNTRYETRNEAVPLGDIMTGWVETGGYQAHDESRGLVDLDIGDTSPLIGHPGWDEAHFVQGSASQGILCIVFPESPESPPPCPTPDVEPSLPCPPPHPCDAAWTAQQISPLPVMPQPDFSASNPGCNQYPPCSACDLAYD